MSHDPPFQKKRADLRKSRNKALSYQQNNRQNMKRREAKTVPSTDLLVCFPSKPICSPARSSHQHNHRRKKSPGQASPLLWSKDKQISEPTSPKVTCAGQIKVRPRTRLSWRADIADGERKNKKKPSWVEFVGLKKEMVQLLACFRTARCDFRCFGWSPHITSDEYEEEEGNGRISETSRSMIFSELFMVVRENEEGGMMSEGLPRGSDSGAVAMAGPPANALLLMRCRSAPGRDWLQGEKEEERLQRKDKRKSKNLGSLMAEEKRNRRLEDVLEKTETWIVGRNAGHFFRSRSWKR